MSEPGKQLTVAIIARDAETLLAQTIESAWTLADKIVVLDTGSCDNTVQIAQNLGAKVVTEAWQDDFSAARNACYQVASGAWVLWLDAGETIESAHAAQLRLFVDQHADEDTAYLITVETAPLEPDDPCQKQAALRLIPGNAVIQFMGRVRETLFPSLASLGIEVEGSPFTIQRGVHVHDAESRATKARRNIRLADLEMQVAGPEPSLLNCIADAFFTLGDAATSERFYRRAVSEAPKGSTELLESYYGLLSVLSDDPAAADEMMTACHQALEIYPLDAQLLCAMGGCLQSRDEDELALRSYKLAYEHGQVNPLIEHLDGIEAVAASCAGLLLQKTGDREQARVLLTSAAASYPQNADLRRQAIEANVDAGETDTALALVDLPGIEWSKPNLLRDTVYGASLAAQGNYLIARSNLEMAYRQGYRDTFCMRWFLLTLVRGGQAKEATNLVNEWKAGGADSNEVDRYYAALLGSTDLASAKQQISRRFDSPSAATPYGAQMRATSSIQIDR